MTTKSSIICSPQHAAKARYRDWPLYISGATTRVQKVKISHVEICVVFFSTYRFNMWKFVYMWTFYMWHLKIQHSTNSFSPLLRCIKTMLLRGMAVAQNSLTTRAPLYAVGTSWQTTPTEYLVVVVMDMAIMWLWTTDISRVVIELW